MRKTNAQKPLTLGVRMTKARQEIVSVLAHAPHPLTIQMIVAEVQANEASVYRTVRLLEREHMIESIAYPDGTRRYALESHHHHHIICTKCGFTVHLPCTAMKEQVNHSQFSRIDHHEVTYYGACTSCA